MSTKVSSWHPGKEKAFFCHLVQVTPVAADRPEGLGGLLVLEAEAPKEQLFAIGGPERQGVDDIWFGEQLHLTRAIGAHQPEPFIIIAVGGRFIDYGYGCPVWAPSGITACGWRCW